MRNIAFELFEREEESMRRNYVAFRIRLRNGVISRWYESVTDEDASRIWRDMADGLDIRPVCLAWAKQIHNQMCKNVQVWSNQAEEHEPMACEAVSMPAGWPEGWLHKVRVSYPVA